MFTPESVPHACMLVPHPLSPPHAATRKRMEPLLRDPKVQSALSDPRVKQIMQVLKADPEKAQRYVKMFPHGVYKHISM